MPRLTLVFATALMVVGAGQAVAEPTSAGVERAARHYERGKAHMDANRPALAAKEFLRAQALSPSPALLFNIAQAYYDAGERRSAQEYYDKYLAVDSVGPGVEIARERLDELTRELGPLPEPEPPVVVGVVRAPQRPRRRQVGVAVRLGIPGDTAHRNTSEAELAYPAAGLVTPALGVDVNVAYQLFGLGKRFLPSVRVAGVLGFTTMEGTYPCPTRDPTNCEPPAGRSGRVSHTNSTTAELRGQLRADLVRLKRLGVRQVTELGLGVETLANDSTEASFDPSGVHATWMVGLGVGVVFHGVVRSFAHESSLGVLLQLRERFGSATDPGSDGSGLVYAGGVPETVHTWWFTLEFGMGRR